MMQKGFVPVYLLIGVLILAALGGAYYLQSKEALLHFGKSQTPIPQTQNPVVVSQTPQASPNETANPDLIGANWKTYINQSFRFSMKYPNDWIVKENGSNSIWVTNTNSETLIIGIKNATDAVKITKSGTVITKDLTKRGSVDFLQQPVEKDVLVFKGNDMSIMYDEAREIPRGNLVFTLSLDKTYIVVEGSPPQVLSSTSESIADQILSTFKFIP